MAEAVDGNVTCDLDTYLCSEKGLWLPLVNEYTWPRAGRAIVYCLGLLWIFLGVAIIADNFMCAIEKICGKTRVIKVAKPESEKGYEEVEIKVWNNAVANLTLMALGSSAPEIMLSIIEIIGNNFKAGELGPSTIVGSAAFNMLVITGICVLSIPSPDVRRIRSVKVFAITAFFSIFAYLWLIIILVGRSPDYVELWEAIITLLFFPILVVLAYVADKDFCSKKHRDETEMQEIGLDTEKELLFDKDGQVNEKAMRDFIRDLRKHNHELTEDEVSRLAAKKMLEDQSHDHLWYRINATRQIAGSYKLTPAMSEQLHEVYETLQDHHHDSAEPHATIEKGTVVDMSEGGTRSVVEFTATKVSILENDGRVRVGIRRYGKTSNRALVRFETIDGTAESQKDYIPVKNTIVFEKDETYKYVDIEIINDNEWEPDEVFFAKISVDPSDPASSGCLIGKRAIMEIIIINDDEPGTFEFAKPSLLFKESAGKALIPIERSNGADGQVTLKWKTTDMTAVSGQDFEGGEGTLTFEHGETTKTLEITIFDDQEKEKDETFKIELLELAPDTGAKLGRIKKTIITIVNDDDFNGMVSRLVLMSNANIDALRVETSTYQDQFRNAMNVNGGDIDSATHLDYLMHFLTFGFKIVFALVPPPSIWGGWLSFVVSLGMITIVTIFIGDLASIFGCLVTLRDPVNAITLVALGTSLPDLFASKQAATQEKTADNSIGNVTGSNSVNVFLGLGLPWTVAAIYWTAKGETFQVRAGNLAPSVALYAIAGCLCIGTLVLRRFVGAFGKAELGGPFGPKVATCIFFVLLWFLYVLLSSLQVYEHIDFGF